MIRPTGQYNKWRQEAPDGGFQDEPEWGKLILIPRTETTKNPDERNREIFNQY